MTYYKLNFQKDFGFKIKRIPLLSLLFKQPAINYHLPTLSKTKYPALDIQPFSHTNLTTMHLHHALVEPVSVTVAILQVDEANPTQRTLQS